jgi:heterodisulfide reductase subunit A
MAVVKEITGSAGDFHVTIEQYPRYVSIDDCTACGTCSNYCPVHPPDPYNQYLKTTTAINIPYTQAVPASYWINGQHCLFIQKRECKQCSRVCQRRAIDFNQKRKIIKLHVGAIILCPGFKPYDPSPSNDYRYRESPNVISAMEFERISCASGPYSGKILRPSDLKRPERIAFIQCAGSREKSPGNTYCSSVCCKVALKDSLVALEHEPDIKITIFYIDMRTFGKGFEEFFIRAKELGVRFIRSKVSELIRDPDTEDLFLRYLDEDGRVKEEVFNLVVLSAGIEPPKGISQLAISAGIELDRNGFCKTNPFSPLETTRKGIFVAGAFQGPKSIPESVIQASGAAAMAGELLHSSRWTMTKERDIPAERSVDEEEPRIGVFVCRCGKNIGDVVNCDDLKGYAEGLPGVTFSTSNLYSCSQDAQLLIQEIIQNQRLNRIVIAACTPRTHEPLFQETARGAGLNSCLVEMVNIRDQCSWVHTYQKEEATEKAKDLVRMAVAKAYLLEPLPEKEVDVIRRVLVIGGGLSGMTSAISIAEQGFDCILVEKEENLGGNLRNLYYTLSGSDPQGLLRDITKKVTGNPRIRVLTSTRIENIQGFVGNFTTTLSIYKKDGMESMTIDHGAIIVATGARTCRPNKYLYGANPKVILQADLEEKMGKSGKESLRGIKDVVMIQCVESRDEKHPYCSQVCCSHALKNAMKIKDYDPTIRVTILYRDMMSYGFLEEYYILARKRGVNFIRYELDIPPDVRNDGEGAIIVEVRDPVSRNKILLRTDLVVLSPAIESQGEMGLIETLNIPLSPDGFFLESHVQLRPVESCVDGIYLCGMAHFPKPIEESIAQAKAAAQKAISLLSKGKVKVDPVVSFVDQVRCTGCGICEAFCPFQAIRVKKVERGRKAETIPPACKGCGVCASYCPSRAIRMGRFTDEQIIAQIRAFGRIMG